MKDAFFLRSSLFVKIHESILSTLTLHLNPFPLANAQHLDDDQYMYVCFIHVKVELKGIHDEGVTRVQADSKRDYGNAADVGASEQLLVGESDRRPAFVAKVKRLLENRYEVNILYFIFRTIVE